MHTRRAGLLALTANLLAMACAAVATDRHHTRAPLPASLAGQSAAEDGAGTRTAAAIERLVRQYHDNGQFDGAVLVAERGQLLYKGAVGLANREWRTPNTVTTKFRIGSVTKPFTAVLTLQSVQRGELRLNGRLSEYLPDYPAATAPSITIHHLLSHTSGLVDYPDVEGFEWNRERLFYTPEALIKEFAGLALKCEPGACYRYSNFGYYLLSLVLEKVTGKSYSTLLAERIFEPAGMTGSSTADNRTILAERASGYVTPRDGPTRNAPPFDTSVVRGAGDIISTVDDLWRFDQALYTDRLLTGASRDLMFTPTLPDQDNYAYGWYVSLPAKHPGPRWVRHSGSVNGFSAILVRLLDERVTIVLLANMHGVQTIPMSDAIRAIVAGSR